MTDQEIVDAYTKGLARKQNYKMWLRGPYYSLICCVAHSSYLDKGSGTRYQPTTIAMVKNGNSFWGGDNTTIHEGKVTKEKQQQLKQSLQQKNLWYAKEADKRYPYTHADDYIRTVCGYNQQGTKISRSDASQIISAIAVVLQMPNEQLFNKIADYALIHSDEIDKKGVDDLMQHLQTHVEEQC